MESIKTEKIEEWKDLQVPLKERRSCNVKWALNTQVYGAYNYYNLLFINNTLHKYTYLIFIKFIIYFIYYFITYFIFNKLNKKNK